MPATDGQSASWPLIDENFPLFAGIYNGKGSTAHTMTAAPDRRDLLFIGDGSFQEAAQELSTMLRHDRKPVIFLINNGG